MYHLILNLFKAIGLIPRNWSKKIGNSMGMLWYGLDKNRRKITIDNLTLAFKNEKSEKEIEHLAKRVFQNIGQMIFEIGWALRLDRKRLHKYFIVRGLPTYRNAFNKNKGVLALTGHTGNWELLSIVADISQIPIHVVYRPLDFKPMDEVISTFRTRFGATIIPKSRAMRKILNALKNGEVVGMLLDQSVDWYNGVFVDFFGQITCTSDGLAMIALKTKAPVIPAFLAREGNKYIAEFGDEILMVETGDKTKDIQENTQRYNKAIEDFIRRYPDQWFWVHRRWKTLPYCNWSPSSSERKINA